MSRRTKMNLGVTLAQLISSVCLAKPGHEEMKDVLEVTSQLAISEIVFMDGPCAPNANPEKDGVATCKSQCEFLKASPWSNPEIKVPPVSSQPSVFTFQDQRSRLLRYFDKSLSISRPPARDLFCVLRL